MVINQSAAEKIIFDYIGDLLQEKGQLRDFALNENLVASGRLDSLAVIQIVVFLEQKFDFKFGEDFDPTEFESPEKILRLYLNKINRG